MYASNWRAAQPQGPGAIAGGATGAVAGVAAGVAAGAVAGAMNLNNWNAAQAAGGAAGAMNSGDWRTQLLPDSRQRIINKINATLHRHIPVYGQEGVRELMTIAVRFEEKIYNVATSPQDYLRKISLKMLTMETKSQNPMTNSRHPNAASSGLNAHGPEPTSCETISGPEESDEEEDNGDVSKEDNLEEVAVKEEQKSAVGHKGNVKVAENEISCGLSSGAKLDERLAQVEERLEKMEAHSEKVEKLLVDINEKMNYLVKMQDAKVSRDIKRPAKYMSSSWTGNGRLKRKHRVAEIIRQSCKHRRLGRDDKTVVHPVALRDDCVENNQRKLDAEEQKN